MYQRVLLAYDGSDAADKAFDSAIEWVLRFQSQLWVLSVIHVPDYGGQVETAALIDSAQAQCQVMGQSLIERAAAAGVSLIFMTRIGHPAESIVAAAKEFDAELIVLGHRGKSLIQRWLTGSTTKQVMGYAHCSVFVVR